jgi:hypothetical protein
MNKPTTPGAAAAEIQRQYESAAEIERQNTQRRAKEVRRQLQRDRATINAAKLNSPNAAEANAAVATISKTVLRGTGLSVSDITSPETLARVTSAVLKDPTTIDLGVKRVLDLKVSSADAKSIPAPVLQRLIKLAK